EAASGKCDRDHRDPVEVTKVLQTTPAQSALDHRGLLPQSIYPCEMAGEQKGNGQATPAQRKLAWAAVSKTLAEYRHRCWGGGQIFDNSVYLSAYQSQRKLRCEVIASGSRPHPWHCETGQRTQTSVSIRLS